MAGGALVALEEARTLAGQAQQAVQPVQDTLQSTLLDPLSEHVMPWVGAAKKFGMGANAVRGGALKAKKAHKQHKGKEKVFSLDENGEVVSTKRGKDDGTTANAFQAKLSQHNREKGIRKMIGGTSKMGAATGDVLSIPLVGASPVGQAITGVSNIVGGTTKAVMSGVDAGRAQHGWSKSRKQEHALLKQGEVSGYGFQAAKHHSGDFRNKSIGKSASGALKATGGVIDTATALDPTMVVGATVHKGLSIGGKAKKGIKALEVYKEERRRKKLEKAHQKAESGDEKAMRYLLSHDPRFASAQMMMHAQDGSKTQEERDAHSARVGEALRMGEAGQAELQTGKLSEFDKLYAARTGRKQEVGAKAKDKAKMAVYMPLIGAGYGMYSKTIGKAKKARRRKKENKLGLNDRAHLKAVKKEFGDVKRFRAEKTVEEIKGTIDQKGMKKEFEAQEEGTAQGFSAFEYDTGLSEEDALEAGMDKHDKLKKKRKGLGKKSSHESLPDWLRLEMVDVLRQGRAQAAQTPQAQTAAPQPTPVAPAPVVAPTLGPAPTKPLPAIPAGPAPSYAPPPIPQAAPALASVDKQVASAAPLSAEAMTLDEGDDLVPPPVQVDDEVQGGLLA